MLRDDTMSAKVAPIQKPVTRVNSLNVKPKYALATKSSVNKTSAVVKTKIEVSTPISGAKRLSNKVADVSQGKEALCEKESERHHTNVRIQEGTHEITQPLDDVMLEDHSNTTCDDDQVGSDNHNYNPNDLQRNSETCSIENDTVLITNNMSEAITSEIIESATMEDISNDKDDLLTCPNKPIMVKHNGQEDKTDISKGEDIHSKSQSDKYSTSEIDSISSKRCTKVDVKKANGDVRKVEPRSGETSDKTMSRLSRTSEQSSNTTLHSLACKKERILATKQGSIRMTMSIKNTHSSRAKQVSSTKTSTAASMIASSLGSPRSFRHSEKTDNTDNTSAKLSNPSKQSNQAKRLIQGTSLNLRQSQARSNSSMSDTPPPCERCSRSRSRSSTPSALSTSSTENSPRHRPSNRNLALRKSSIDSTNSCSSAKSTTKTEKPKSKVDVKSSVNTGSKIASKPENSKVQAISSNKFRSIVKSRVIPSVDKKLTCDKSAVRNTENKGEKQQRTMSRLKAQTENRITSGRDLGSSKLSGTGSQSKVMSRQFTKNESVKSRSGSDSCKTKDAKTSDTQSAKIARDSSSRSRSVTPGSTKESVEDKLPKVMSMSLTNDNNRMSRSRSGTPDSTKSVTTQKPPRTSQLSIKEASVRSTSRAGILDSTKHKSTSDMSTRSKAINSSCKSDVQKPVQAWSKLRSATLKNSTSIKQPATAKGTKGLSQRQAVVKNERVGNKTTLDNSKARIPSTTELSNSKIRRSMSRSRSSTPGSVKREQTSKTTKLDSSSVPCEAFPTHIKEFKDDNVDYQFNMLEQKKENCDKEEHSSASQKIKEATVESKTAKNQINSEYKRGPSKSGNVNSTNRTKPSANTSSLERDSNSKSRSTMSASLSDKSKSIRSSLNLSSTDSNKLETQVVKARKMTEHRTAYSKQSDLSAAKAKVAIDKWVRKTTVKSVSQTSKKSCVSLSANTVKQELSTGKSNTFSAGKKDNRTDNAYISSENKISSSSATVRLKSENKQIIGTKSKSNQCVQKDKTKLLSNKSKYLLNKTTSETKDRSDLNRSSIPPCKLDCSLPDTGLIIPSNSLNIPDYCKCCQNSSIAKCENHIAVCSSKQNDRNDSPFICSISQNNQMNITGVSPEHIITVDTTHSSNSVTTTGTNSKSEQEWNTTVQMLTCETDTGSAGVNGDTLASTDQQGYTNDRSPVANNNGLSVDEKLALPPLGERTDLRNECVYNERTLSSLSRCLNATHEHVLLQDDATFIMNTDSIAVDAGDVFCLTRNCSKHNVSELQSGRDVTQTMASNPCGDQSQCFQSDQEIGPIAQVCEQCGECLYDNTLIDQGLPGVPIRFVSDKDLKYVLCESCLKESRQHGCKLQTYPSDQILKSDARQLYACGKTCCSKCQNDKESEIQTCILQTLEMMGSNEVPVQQGCVQEMQNCEDSISTVRSASSGTGAAIVGIVEQQENKIEDSTILSTLDDRMCNDSLSMTKCILDSPDIQTDGCKHKAADSGDGDLELCNFEQQRIPMCDDKENKLTDLSFACEDVSSTLIQKENLNKECFDHSKDTNTSEVCSVQEYCENPKNSAEDHHAGYNLDVSITCDTNTCDEQCDNSALKDTFCSENETSAIQAKGDNQRIDTYKGSNCETIKTAADGTTPEQGIVGKQFINSSSVDNTQINVFGTQQLVSESQFQASDISSIDTEQSQIDNNNLSNCDTCTNNQFAKTDVFHVPNYREFQTPVPRLESMAAAVLKVETNKDKEDNDDAQVSSDVNISNHSNNKVLDDIDHICIPNKEPKTCDSTPHSALYESNVKYLYDRHVTKVNSTDEQLCVSNTDENLPSRLLINEISRTGETTYDEHITCTESSNFNPSEHEMFWQNSQVLSENDMPKQSSISYGNIDTAERHIFTQIFQNQAPGSVSCEICEANNKLCSNVSELASTEMSNFLCKLHQVNSAYSLQSDDKCVAFGRHDGSCVDCIALGQECTLCCNVTPSSQQHIPSDDSSENTSFNKHDLLQNVENSSCTNVQQIEGGSTCKIAESINPSKVLAHHDTMFLSSAFEEEDDRLPAEPESRDIAHTPVGLEQDTNSGTEAVVDFSTRDSVKIYSRDSYQDECCDKMEGLSDVKITTQKSSCSQVFSANSIQQRDFIQRYEEQKKYSGHEKHLTVFDGPDTCKTSSLINSENLENKFGTSGHNRDSDSFTNVGLNNGALLQHMQVEDIDENLVHEYETYGSPAERNESESCELVSLSDSLSKSNHCVKQTEGNTDPDLICNISKQETNNVLRDKSECDLFEAVSSQSSMGLDEFENSPVNVESSDIKTSEKYSVVDILPSETIEIGDNVGMKTDVANVVEEQNVVTEQPSESDTNQGKTERYISDVQDNTFENTELTSSCHTQRSSVISSGSCVSDLSENFVDAVEDLEPLSPVKSQDVASPEPGSHTRQGGSDLSVVTTENLETFINEDTSPESFQDAVERLDDDYLTSLTHASDVKNEEIVSQNSSCSTSYSECSVTSMDNMSEWEEFNHDLGEIISYDKAMDSKLDSSKFMRRKVILNDTSASTNSRTSVHKTRTLRSDTSYLKTVASSARTVKCSQIQSNVFRSKDSKHEPGQQVIRSAIFKTGNGNLPKKYYDEVSGTKRDNDEGIELLDGSYTKINGNGDNPSMPTTTSTTHTSSSSTETVSDKNDGESFFSTTTHDAVSESNTQTTDMCSTSESNDAHSNNDVAVVYRENHSIINTKIETALIKRTQRRRRRQHERQIMHLQHGEGVQNSENTLPQEVHVSSDTSCNINIPRDNGFIQDSENLNSLHSTSACTDTDKPISTDKSHIQSKTERENLQLESKIEYNDLHEDEFISETTSIEHTQQLDGTSENKSGVLDIPISVVLPDKHISDICVPLEHENDKSCAGQDGRSFEIVCIIDDGEKEDIGQDIDTDRSVDTSSNDGFSPDFAVEIKAVNASNIDNSCDNSDDGILQSKGSSSTETDDTDVHLTAPSVNTNGDDNSSLDVESRDDTTGLFEVEIITKLDDQKSAPSFQNNSEPEPNKVDVLQINRTSSIDTEDTAVIITPSTNNNEDDKSSVDTESRDDKPGLFEVEIVTKIDDQRRIPSVQTNIEPETDNADSALHINQASSTEIERTTVNLTSNVDTNKDDTSSLNIDSRDDKTGLFEVKIITKLDDQERVEPVQTTIQPETAAKPQSNRSDIDFDDIEFIDADTDSQDMDYSDLDKDVEHQANVVAEENSSPNVSFIVSFETETDTEPVTYDVALNTEAKDNTIQCVVEADLDDTLVQDVNDEIDTTLTENEIVTSDDSKTGDATVELSHTMKCEVDRELHAENVQYSLQEHVCEQKHSSEELTDNDVNEQTTTVMLPDLEISSGRTKEAVVTETENEESQTEICEESNISVARALAMEREKMAVCSETTVKREFQTSKRVGRRATIQTCSSIENQKIVETKKKSRLTPPGTLKKSHSFKCERKEVAKIDDGESKEKEDIQTKKVSGVCMNFMTKTKSSIQRSRQQEKGAVSPTPGRKLMKWVNDNGKWMRIPVYESDEGSFRPVAAPKPQHHSSVSSESYINQTEETFVSTEAVSNVQVLTDNKTLAKTLDINQINVQTANKSQITQVEGVEQVMESTTDTRAVDGDIEKKDLNVESVTESPCDKSSGLTENDHTSKSFVDNRQSDTAHCVESVNEETKSASEQIPRDQDKSERKGNESIIKKKEPDTDKVNIPITIVNKERMESENNARFKTVKSENIGNVYKTQNHEVTSRQISTSHVHDEVKIVGTALDSDDGNLDTHVKRQELLFGLVDSFNRRKSKRVSMPMDESIKTDKSDVNATASQRVSVMKRTTMTKTETSLKITEDKVETVENDMPRPIPKLKAVKIQEEIFEGTSTESKDSESDDEYCFSMVPLPLKQSLIPDRARTLPIRKSKTFAGLRDLERNRMHVNDMAGTDNNGGYSQERSSRKDSNTPQQLELPVVKKRLKSPDKIARRHKVSLLFFM